MTMYSEFQVSISPMQCRILQALERLLERCSPMLTLRQIAKEAQISVESAKSHLRWMERLGYISRELSYDKGRPYIYTINLDPSHYRFSLVVGGRRVYLTSYEAVVLKAILDFEYPTVRLVADFTSLSNYAVTRTLSLLEQKSILKPTNRRENGGKRSFQVSDLVDLSSLQ